MIGFLGAALGYFGRIVGIRGLGNEGRAYRRPSWSMFGIENACGKNAQSLMREDKPTWRIEMPSQVAAEQLQGIDLLDGMKHGEIREILGMCEDVRFPAGQIIFASGELHRSLYFLRQGKVEILLATPTAGEVVLAAFEPPEAFGESNFFYPGPHVASARAATAVDAIRLDRPQFDRLLAQDSLAAYHLAANAAQALAGRLRATDRWICQLLHEHQDQRVAEMWHHYHEHFQLTPESYPGFMRP
jgi:CRP-like cAMP-binding protein